MPIVLIAPRAAPEVTMINLNDILLAAQRGTGIEHLARYCGLSREQATMAIDVLLPAFSLGLKQQTQNRDTLTHFIKLLGMDGLSLFDSASPLRPSAAWSEAVLGQLFGSHLIRDAVATQTSAATGLPREAIMALMPMAAAMLMGGLATSASHRDQSHRDQSNLFAWPPGGVASTADTFGAWMQQALTASVMFSGDGASSPKAPYFPDLSQAGLDAMTRMFDTGRDLQDQYATAMQNLFDALIVQKAKSDP
jgi:hypothetical protein